MKFFRKKENIESYSDLQLITAYQVDGDLKYVTLLFERYKHLILGTCFKHLKNQMDSEDAVMNIYEILIKDLIKTEVVNFNSWLYSVCRNHCYKLLNNNKKEQSEIEMLGNFVEKHEELALCNELIDNCEGKELSKAMKMLKEDHRRCIEMFYLKGMRYKEIENSTEYNLNDIKSHIQNGKRKLKIILSENGELKD